MDMKSKWLSKISAALKFETFLLAVCCLLFMYMDLFAV